MVFKFFNNGINSWSNYRAPYSNNLKWNLIHYHFDKILNQVQKAKKQIIQRFWERNLYYIKADNVNKFVILDKTVYYEEINTVIYWLLYGTCIKLIKNQLPRMISEARNIHSKCKKVRNTRIKKKLYFEPIGFKTIFSTSNSHSRQIYATYPLSCWFSDS